MSEHSSQRPARIFGLTSVGVLSVLFLLFQNAVDAAQRSLVEQRQRIDALDALAAGDRIGPPADLSALQHLFVGAQLQWIVEDGIALPRLVESAEGG